MSEQVETPVMSVDQLATELGAAVEAFKSINAEREAEVRKFGSELAETTEKFDKVNNRLDELAEMKSQIEALQTASNRPTVLQDLEADKKEAIQEWAKATLKASDHQEMIAMLTPEHQKVLSLSNPSEAGHLAVPPEVADGIIKAIIETSPIRSIARVRQTMSTEWKQRRRTGVFAAQWVAEQGTRSETTGLKYGVETIPNHELYAEISLSRQLIEDAFINMEAELNEEAGEEFGVAEGAAFVNGDGNGKPEGFLDANSGVTAITATASGSAVLDDADDLIDLKYELKTGWLARAVFGMRRTTIRTVRKLKDADGQYLWQPSFQIGQPDNFDGHAIVEMPDMPAVGASAKAVVFGDFGAGYTIVDRIGMELLVDPSPTSRPGWLIISSVAVSVDR